jgi:hypothetical protein
MFGSTLIGPDDFAFGALFVVGAAAVKVVIGPVVGAIGMLAGVIVGSFNDNILSSLPPDSNKSNISSNEISLSPMLSLNKIFNSILAQCCTVK